MSKLRVHACERTCAPVLLVWFEIRIFLEHPSKGSSGTKRHSSATSTHFWSEQTVLLPPLRFGCRSDIVAAAEQLDDNRKQNAAKTQMSNAAQTLRPSEMCVIRI